MLTIEQFRTLWQLLSCLIMDDSYCLEAGAAEAAYTLLARVQKILEEN